MCARVCPTHTGASLRTASTCMRMGIAITLSRRQMYYLRQQLSSSPQPNASEAPASRWHRQRLSRIGAALCLLLFPKTILEEEYQESFGFNDHSESVPSILRKITPPRLSDPPPGTAINRHSTYNPSRAHHYHHHPSSFVAPPTTSDRGDSIYNEPCDAKRRGCSPKKSAFRRASLATTIYCDTEHHRESYHAASPQVSAATFLAPIHSSPPPATSVLPYTPLPPHLLCSSAHQRTQWDTRAPHKHRVGHAQPRLLLFAGRWGAGGGRWWDLEEESGLKRVHVHTHTVIAGRITDCQMGQATHTVIPLWGRPAGHAVSKSFPFFNTDAERGVFATIKRVVDTGVNLNSTDSPDSLKLNANNHLRDASGSSGFVAVNGRRSGTNSHGARCWWEQDSGSSSLSNSRDVSSHNNPKFE
ncbi:unnamed protein product [Mesocestoides corti]|uniref:Uncharacterized protein n=1 Tax=Mesocestoides corti TaxID=53468 RepID=A0A0R3U3L0_MESCO|nr:unnamed protein product [Mesocestoides corti]